MAKKKPTQFKRFSDAMSKIVKVSKDELAKREVAYRRARRRNNNSDTDPAITESTAVPSAADSDVPK